MDLMANPVSRGSAKLPGLESRTRLANPSVLPIAGSRPKSSSSSIAVRLIAMRTYCSRVHTYRFVNSLTVRRQSHGS